MKIELPFPPSSLSGHNNGHWRNKSGDVAKHRRWAKCATMNVFGTAGLPESTGDINLTVRFIPANNRGDRVNYPNRMKPYFDGIADGLKVNDKRFNPAFIFCEPEAPGRVEIYVQVSK